jgi:hypothetical protein
MTTDNFCFYLQNRLIQTSQTGGQQNSEREREREGGRKREYIFLKGMTGALAPFSYIVINNICHQIF